MLAAAERERAGRQVRNVIDMLPEDVDARRGAQESDVSVPVKLQKSGAERIEPPEGFPERGRVLPIGLREHADKSGGQRPAPCAFAEELPEDAVPVGRSRAQRRQGREEYGRVG